ncbi:FecR family protein [Chitinophaga sp. GCM10012297]|uniref:FecR family protein n=1 Tax=Chitinophaga chungangae TaxID=2821488 RepID=A0ABS3YFJ1_9BACT|nr:FecR family protein [Chitinophaga chungangae]MBO9153448.1 FecR family protein [Chitinophaga chungangae]
MDQQQAEELLTRYAEGTASEAERAMVERWYESEAAGRQLGDEHFFEHLNTEIWAGTLEKAGISRPPARRKIFSLYRAAAAAAVLLLVAAGLVWLMKGRETGAVRQPVAAQQENILPGSNKAILTLGNGQSISLTDAADGELARQGDTRISKTKEGQLAYEPGAGTGAASHNTVSTPRGGQYRIDLPDGTRVWLNAASSLTFPASFAGLRDRSVELSGEAYFEVAGDAGKPFKVISNGHTVEVLGTHFNVNAYHDEPDIKTTLLEGAVKVNGSLLKPGQQSVLHNGTISIRDTETEAATAWKNGEFIFNGQDFKTVMRMISRWYDVDVEYEYDPKPFRIGGEVSRGRNIAEVLKMLEVTGGVKFRIEDRTIKVIR